MVFFSLVTPAVKLGLTIDIKLRCAEWDRSRGCLEGRGSDFAGGERGGFGGGLWEAEYGGDEGVGGSGSFGYLFAPSIYFTNVLVKEIVARMFLKEDFDSDSEAEDEQDGGSSRKKLERILEGVTRVEEF